LPALAGARSRPRAPDGPAGGGRCGGSTHALIRVVREIDPDRLDPRVLVVRLDAVVPPAEARLLEAAEGGRDIAPPEAVHRDGAGPDSPRATQRPLDVRREDRSRQAVLRIVGKTDGLLEAAHRQDRQYRPEDLLAHLRSP